MFGLNEDFALQNAPYASRASPPIPLVPTVNCLLSSAVVMEMLGYRNRASFWQFVHSSGLPHIRLNARHIRFDSRALNAWLERRTVGGVKFHHR